MYICKSCCTRVVLKTANTKSILKWVPPVGQGVITFGKWILVSQRLCFLYYCTDELFCSKSIKIIELTRECMSL